jgi:hypothetical protein
MEEDAFREKFAAEVRRRRDDPHAWRRERKPNGDPRMSMYGISFRLSNRISLEGFDARVVFATADQREQICEKLQSAMQLFQLYAPVRFACFRRDVARIYVGPIPARAQWINDSKLCALDFDHLRALSTTPSSVALTLVHEGMHARLDRAGFGYDEGLRSRIEDLCIRAEALVACRMPDGERLAARAEQKRSQFDPEFWTDEAHLDRMRAYGTSRGWLGTVAFRIGYVLRRVANARRDRRGFDMIPAAWAAVWVIALSPFTVTQSVHNHRGSLDGSIPLLALVVFVLSPAVWGAASGAAFAVWIALAGAHGGRHALRPRPILLGGLLSVFVAPFLLGTAWASIDTPRTLSLPWRAVALVSAVVNVVLALGSWMVFMRESTEASA